MRKVVVLLAEHDLEVVQRGMVGPELARERRFLGRNREQEQMVDRQHRPDEHGDADQQQLRFGRDRAPGRGLHRDSRFIMKYTSGSTSGSAHTMAAIARSTRSRRRYRIPSVASTCVRSAGPPPV